MVISLPKKLLIAGFGGTGVIIPIAVLGSSGEPSSTPSDRQSSLDSAQTSLVPSVEKEKEPKLCKVLLSSQDRLYEVLMCYDLDKENHVNKVLKNRYGAILFLLDKSSSEYSLKHFDFLLSSETKDERRNYSKERVKKSKWQAYRQEESFGSLFSHEEKDYEKIGSPFMIQWYSESNPEGFAFPYTGSWSYDIFSCCSHVAFSDSIILQKRDLKAGSTLKYWDQRETLDREFLNSLDPLQTDPHDPQLSKLKKEAKYQISLDIGDPKWNHEGGPSPFGGKAYPYRDLSCHPQEKLVNEKIVLNCFK